MSTARSFRAAMKTVLRRLFETGQRMGVDVLPRHFYSEIPDIGQLRRERAWREPLTMVDVAGADPAAQLATLATWAEAVPAAGSAVYSRAVEDNGAAGFGEVEAEVLDVFVRANRPARVVQVGGGVSTAVMSRALASPPAIVCIDPHPTTYLKQQAQSGAIALRQEPAQLTPLSVFSDLEAGDLLFIDSTHTVRPGSEVNRLVLDVLPRLKPGVWVHFHDIYFPYDYPRGLLGDELFFNRESSLVHAFLAMNRRYRIEVSLSMLHYARREDLGRLFPAYRPGRDDQGLALDEGHFPSSLYLRG